MTTAISAAERTPAASDILIAREYPHPIGDLWRVLTDPALIPRWTSKGKGGRPDGFAPVVGNRFRWVAKPMPGWNGIVECEVLEVREPSFLRYTWLGGEDDDLTTVTNLLEPHGNGTRLTFTQTGFTGVGGYIVSRVLKLVRERMLDEGLPEVLREIERGRAR